MSIQKKEPERRRSMGGFQRTNLRRRYATGADVDRLWVSGNTVDGIGCLELARCLTRQTCRLTALELANCELTDENVLVLAEQLSRNRTLVRLNLRENELATFVWERIQP